LPRRTIAGGSHATNPQEKMFGFVIALATLIAILVDSIAFITAPAIAGSDRTAVQVASAECKAEVNEQAKYRRMSLMAKRSEVKKCVAEILVDQ
jgi:hypothetical protein